MSFLKRIVGKIRFKIGHVYNYIFEAILRRRLKNDDFSIICSNCIGGIIYKRLGRTFLSPTINLWFQQDEFIKFVLDLKGYLAEEMVFVDSQYAYPVGLLRDVRIYFTHYKSREEALNAWNRRKERVNYDNLYIIMYDRDGITREDILRIKDLPCKAKIVLSEHERNYEGIDYIKTLRSTEKPFGAQFVDVDWLGIRTFEKQFDFVEFLNQ